MLVSEEKRLQQADRQTEIYIHTVGEEETDRGGGGAGWGETGRVKEGGAPVSEEKRLRQAGKLK